MTWTKLPDSAADDMLDLSDSAFRLHIAAMVYANRIGLDGRIPKARFSLIPVPPRTRRAAVVRELIEAGQWADDGDTYVLADFLRDQPSAEEVALQRRWDVLRQQIRFAKGPDRAEKQASLRRDADEMRDALQAVRNRRKATYSQVNSLVNHYAPLRPVSDPSRPAPSEDEDGYEKAGAGRAWGAPARPDEIDPNVCHLCKCDIEPGEHRNEFTRSDGSVIAEHDRHPVKTYMCIVEYQEWERKVRPPNAEEQALKAWAAAHPAKPDDIDYEGPGIKASNQGAVH
jgi:hypothetical protein